ncbi:hypothetical protein [Thiomicrorhabdus indica]|uniref:hypothetical protein n=1 Tax=Thiomicrorhabdus indica TaxID=2267253 RepID=UPI00102D8606|nr:hypothetical protein [Thiomicrorhabdus indica]
MKQKSINCTNYFEKVMKWLLGDASYNSDSYKRGASAFAMHWKVKDKRKPKHDNLSGKQRK